MDSFRWKVDEHLPVVRFFEKYFKLLLENSVHHDGLEKRMDYHLCGLLCSCTFHVSDTYAHDVFERYVKLDRLPLTDAISVDEVFLHMDNNCKYALVIQDFHTGDPFDLLRSRRMNVTEPYFTSIPPEERNSVKYLISDMYNPYISYVDKYFPNAVPVVDSFHVLQWITRSIDNYM